MLHHNGCNCFVFVVPISASYLTYTAILLLPRRVSVHMHRPQGAVLAMCIWKPIAIYITVVSYKSLGVVQWSGYVTFFKMFQNKIEYFNILHSRFIRRVRKIAKSDY
jgi:hypothetical protein